MSAAKASKFCHSCGRIFTNRASMASNWESVAYCSKTCRQHRSMHNRTDKLIEASFLSLLLGSKEKIKVSCESVQEHDGTERVDVKWRERYRQAARRLANVREVCWIERFEQGKWQAGDGVGSMRIKIRDGKNEEAQKLFDTLSSSRGGKAEATNEEKEEEAEASE